MSRLRLIAFDDDDLTVVSAHLEGAVVTADALQYDPAAQGFLIAAKRRLLNSVGSSVTHCVTGLHVGRVLHVRSRHLDRSSTDALTLLALSFEPKTLPAGTLSLHFEGGAVIQLDVECLEVRLTDLADPSALSPLSST